MTTIAVMNFKGGVGKTTLAVLVANAFVDRKKSVLLCDCDPQMSAMAWSGWSKETSKVEVVKLDRIRPRRPSSTHDVVVMDCPPRYGEQCIAAAIASDVAIVPVCAGPLDVDATAFLIETLKAANETRKSPLPVIFLPNKVQPRLRLTTVLMKALNGLTKRVDNARVSKVSLPLRTAYVEALMNAWTPLSKDLARPINDLCEEALAAVAK